MSLFGFKEKKEIEQLRNQMTPEQLNLFDIQKNIEEAQQRLSAILTQEQAENKKLTEIKAKIIETDEAASLQDFGFYTPHYQYQMSDEYKQQLINIRAKQKNMVKTKTAVIGSTTWTVNGSKAQGTKMVKDMQQLLLRAFNAECDDAIEHVKFNNYENCRKKIVASCDAISKLGQMMSISITQQYFILKCNELQLMYEYQQKKQSEKDELREARERMRDEAKLAKEIEEARKKLEKEQTHYNNALEKINAQLAAATETEEKAAIEQKKAELEQQLQKIDKEFADVDYREANQKAGYVYVISNIGAFGENVYKIGMTRRLEPMERIDELGDASVPFDFDVHALIFTEDAPGLESALHQAFETKKVNYINTRREFFNVTIDEIKKVVKDNYDKSVEFIEIPPAEQYRETLAIKEGRSVN
jgi:hypothetical protein